MTDPNINEKTDDSRCKLLDCDIVGALVATFGHEDEDVQQSSLNAITKLAEHGKFQMDNGSHY